MGFFPLNIGLVEIRFKRHGDRLDGPFFFRLLKGTFIQGKLPIYNFDFQSFVLINDNQTPLFPAIFGKSE